MEDFKKRNNGLEKGMNNDAKNGLKNADQQKKSVSTNGNQSNQFKQNNKQADPNGSKKEESRYFSHKDTQSSMKNPESKKCNSGCDCSRCNDCKPCKPCK